MYTKEEKAIRFVIKAFEDIKELKRILMLLFTV